MTQRVRVVNSNFQSLKILLAEEVVETFPKCEVSKARRKVINALIKVAVGE